MTQNNSYTAYSHHAAKRVVWGVSLGVFLSALDQTIVAPLLQVIGNSLPGGGEVAWVISAYLFAVTIFTPFAGKLSDIYGRRRILVVSLIIFIAASILCAAAQSLWQLILFRVLQGIGGSGLMTMAHAAIADVIPPRERGRYQIYLSGMWALGSIGGPVVGSLLASSVSWRLIFLINVPIALLALLVCATSLKSLPRSQKQALTLDCAGAFLVALIIGNAITMLSWGGGLAAWSWQGILMAIVAEAILITAMISVEKRATDPFLPLSVFSRSDTSHAMALSFSNAFLTFGAMLIFPITFSMIVADHRTSTFLLTPFLCGIALSTFVGGNLARRLGHLKGMMVGASVLTFCGYSFSWLSAAEGSLLLQMIAVTMIGGGIGMIQPAITLAVQSTVDKEHLGVASSSMLLFRSIGGAIGAGVCGAILFARGTTPELPTLPVKGVLLFSEAVAQAQLVCVITAAVGVLLTCTMPQVRLAGR